MLQFQSLGGALEVGASCHVISDGRRSVMLDAGLHPKRDGLAGLPDFGALALPAPSSAVITHAHHDHVGAVPVALRQFPAMRAFATVSGRAVMGRMLRNAASVMARRATAEAPALYDSEVLTQISPRVLEMEWETPLTLTGHPSRGERDATMQVHPAGHVLGAASVSLNWEGTHVLYSGDLALHSQGIVAGAQLPDRCDVLILESTLGMSPELDSWTWDAEAQRLGVAIAEVLAGGGSVLLPAFALGRTQELLHVLTQLREADVFPAATPIYVGGLGRAINDIYDAARHLDLRAAPQFVLGHCETRVMSPEQAAAGMGLGEPSILLMTSGMLNANTASAVLAGQMLAHPQHAIFFVGYVDHEAEGYPVYAAQTGERIAWWGNPDGVDIAARIERFRFTAHALRRDLVSVATRLRPQQILLVHGAPGAQQQLQYALQAALPSTDVQMAWPRRVTPLRLSSDVG